MTDNKPEETDEESQETQEEESQETESQTQESQEESGSEDVAGRAAEALTLEELNETVGRKFDSKEEFKKHYKNLNSFVGDQKRVKTEKEKEKLSEEKDQLAERLERLEGEMKTKDFLADNPDAKDSLDLVKDVANSRNISFQEAWDNHLKDTVTNAKARENELEIGVKSKNRLNTSQAKKYNSLAKKAQEGTATEAEIQELLKNHPGAL